MFIVSVGACYILSFSPEEILELAIGHLDDFFYIGFAESFEEDRDHILKALGIDPPKEKIVSNANPGRPTARDLPASTLELLDELTHLDRIIKGLGSENPLWIENYIKRLGSENPHSLKNISKDGCHSNDRQLLIDAELGRVGGLAVLNLEGIFSRYENPDAVLDRITSASLEEATKIIQGIYSEPIKEELIHKRISEIKKGGGPVVVSAIPQRAERFAKIAEEAGADFFVVQSTVTTARHVATEYTPVDLRKLKKHLPIPLIVGNCVTYEACLELMETGMDALLVGVGPGAACTSREVLGLGVPQVTATADCAAARDVYYKQNGPLRADHHRRRHAHRRRRLQGVRLRRRRGHDRLRLRAGQRGAGPRLSLGHGHAAREPAARHAHPGGHRGHARADPVRPRVHRGRHPEPGGRASAPAWARWARRTSASCSRPS